ncbi:MBL fold metallo-hydrolase [Streptomyces violascens]|uniref:MBL fold metallo-hydrolase n=1 Tax=Streptomyces violascens TaxID=67381 RepID=UPI003655BE23
MSRTKVVPIPVMGRHNINAYLLLGRRPVIVDAGIPGSGQKILDRIAAHGVDPIDVALIVITHGHIDHFGSAAELHRLTGAPIAGHIADLGPYRSGRVREPYPAHWSDGPPHGPQPEAPRPGRTLRPHRARPRRDEP